MRGCHRLQRICRTAGCFRGQQPSANSLQLGKVRVPPAHLAVLCQRQLHAVPCQLLGSSCPAAVLIHHLPVVLAAFFKAHFHLMQFRVLFPQRVVSLCAFLHDLLRHVQHKAVGLGPVHVSAVHVVPQCRQTACQRLCVHPAGAGLHHLPGNVQKAVVTHRGVLCLLHHLLHSLARCPAAAHLCFLRRCHVLAVHVQLVLSVVPDVVPVFLERVRPHLQPLGRARHSTLCFLRHFVRKIFGKVRIMVDKAVVIEYTEVRRDR